MTVDIAKDWRNLSPADKKKYVDAAEANRQATAKEYRKFYYSLEPQQRIDIERILDRKLRVPGAKVSLRRELEVNAGAPPLALTDYFLYVKDQRSKGPAHTSVESTRDFAKRCGEQWKTLSDEEKAVSRWFSQCRQGAVLIKALQGEVGPDEEGCRRLESVARRVI